MPDPAAEGPFRLGPATAGADGVAAALKMSSGNETPLDSAWILFNMPKATSSEQLSPSDAGFLFGMGLNGHLAQLNLFNIHEYLAKSDLLTSVAVLLGIAAAKRGSADLQVRLHDVDDDVSYVAHSFRCTRCWRRT